MGKSYRNDARNDRWRKAKQRKNDNKKYKPFNMEGQEPEFDPKRVGYSPFDDPRLDNSFDN